MAPVIKELERYPVADPLGGLFRRRSTGRCSTRCCDLFGIVPDYDLNVMRADQRLPQLTARLFSGLDDVFGEVKPDWVLAQGDTTTVFVAAMEAFYHRARFGHVEAGLRTGNKHQPFPEEVNRRIADLVADVYFAPTDHARAALLERGLLRRATSSSPATP